MMKQQEPPKEEKNANIGYECSIDDYVMRQLSSNKADGSEAALSIPAPLTRVQSTPLGSRVTYAMRRRVISRGGEDRDRHDDDDDDTTEQESAGFMSDQTIKSDDYNEAVPLVKTNSALSADNISCAMKRVLSQREVDGLIFPPQTKSSGYELRKFKSTPPKGLERGYAPNKRTISYDSSTHEEKNLRIPYAMVKAKSFMKMGGRKTRRKKIGKTGDDTTIYTSPITSSNTDGQGTLCISKKFMFALMPACVLMSMGAYFLMMTYSARAPDETTTAGKSYSFAMEMEVDGVEEIATAQEVMTIEPMSDTPLPPPPPSVKSPNIGNLAGTSCDEDGKWFKLELITDNAGNETSWQLERMGGGEWRSYSVSKPHESNKKYSIRMCIPPADYRFIIRDGGINGMCCSNGLGSYSGYLRGTKIFESPNGDEDWGERVHSFTLPASVSVSTVNTTSTGVPTTSPTTPPFTFTIFPSEASSATSFPETSSPTMPPRKESASPTLTSSEQETLFPTNPSSPSPSLEPSQLSSVTSPPLTSTPTNLPSPVLTAAPTSPLTGQPVTAAPTPPPTGQPVTAAPTPPPTDLPLPTEDTITKIFFIADTPYSDDERYNLMPNHIDQLEDDGDFLVHLGDLMYAVADRCREGAYSIAADILQKARMPTFVVPGDNDINDCPNIEHGEDMWMEYFHLFDKKHWNHSFDVTRWGKLDESFGFLHKRVLFLGLNMIGGTPYSWTEKTERHRMHLEQVKALFEAYEGKFDVIVLMKHADPGHNHRDFFGDGTGDGLFIDLIRDLGKPTIHLHGDSHYYYEKEGDYSGVDNYMRISLVGRSQGPPISVTIDVSKPNPITVSRRQSNLRVDCCVDGWPRQ